MDKWVHNSDGEFKSINPWCVGARVQYRTDRKTTGVITMAAHEKERDERKVVRVQWDGDSLDMAYFITDLKLL